MKRIVVGMPGLTGGPEAESVLRGAKGIWEEVGAVGRVFRTSPESGVGVSEAAWFGLEPDRVQIAPGPLLVAALKADPPERSVQFVLSWMSVDEAGVLGEVGSVTAEEVRELGSAMAKLGTARLTPLLGRGVEHGLVWEQGSLELGVCSRDDALGERWEEVLPEGDGERVLGQFIGDSLNLLDGMEFNRRREGEGLAKANILWPWGFGFRGSVPSLAVRRGEVATVFGTGFAMEGLSRLTGYRFETVRTKGVHTAESAWSSLAELGSAVLVSPKTEEMRRLGRIDELAFEFETMGRELVERLWTKRESEPFRLAVLGQGVDGGEGLGMTVDSSRVVLPGTVVKPFDERVWDDPGVRSRTIAEAAEWVLTGGGSSE